VVRLLAELFIVRGYRAGENLLYVEELGAGHNEAAWGRRFPDALQFLLG